MATAILATSETSTSRVSIPSLSDFLLRFRARILAISRSECRNSLGPDFPEDIRFLGKFCRGTPIHSCSHAFDSPPSPRIIRRPGRDAPVEARQNIPRNVESGLRTVMTRLLIAPWPSLQNGVIPGPGRTKPEFSRAFSKPGRHDSALSVSRISSASLPERRPFARARARGGRRRRRRTAVRRCRGASARG